MPASNKTYFKRAGLWHAGAVLAATIWLGTSASHAQKIRFIDTDPQQVGTAQPAQLGLADSLWAGSTRDGLADAIEAVQSASPLPAAHKALAAMLSAAAAPPVADPPGQLESPTLISRRVAALVRLGAGEDAAALAGRAPGEFRDGHLLAGQADALLLRNDLSGACGLLDSQSAGTATVPLQPLRAFCRQISGQNIEATAAAMLSSMPGTSSDDTFAALFLAMQYPARSKPSDIAPATPLHAAMVRYMRLRPAAGAQLGALPAPVMASLAQNPNLPFAMRTQAMERAVAGNAGPVDTLMQLYLEGGGDTGVGPAYRSTAFAQNMPDRLTALQSLWAQARQHGLLAQLAPYTLATIAGLDLAGADPAFIRDALRAALLAQDRAAIANWRDAQNAAALQPAGMASRDASYALLALAGESVPPVEQWWTAWKQAANPSEAQQQLVGGTLGAVGIGFALMPSPKITRSTKAGTIAKLSDKAPGEAALRALAALSGDSAGDIGMQVTAVRMLALVHPGHARALAVELAVASGL